MKGPQRKVPVNYVLGYMFCLSLSHIAGYATFKLSKNVVLTAFIGTLLITMFLSKFGNEIVLAFCKKDNLKRAMSKMFGILGLIVVVVCLIAVIDPFSEKCAKDDSKCAKEAKGGIFKSLLFTCLFLMVALFYMVLDMVAITGGKYCQYISHEDYIYGSAKLFADFVLVFTLLATLLGDSS